MSTRKLWWSDFAAPEFEGLDPARTIAVFPVAAIEQHGPHLPAGCDTIIAEHLAEAARRAPDPRHGGDRVYSSVSNRR